MTSLRLAWLSLTRRRAPTLIALAAIAASVACSGLLLRLYELSGARLSMLARGGDAIVGAKAGGIEILLGSLNAEGAYPDFLPQALFESLRKQQAVRFEDGATGQPGYLEEVIPVLVCARIETGEASYRVLGTDESFFRRPRSEDSLELAEGRFATGPAEVVLGSAIAEREHLKTGDEVRVSAWTGPGAIHDAGTLAQAPMTFRVSGILKPTQTTWDRQAYTNVAQAQDLVRLTDFSSRSTWGAQVLSYYLIYLKPSGFPGLQSLINRRTVAQVISVPEQEERLRALTGTGRGLGLFITAFLMLLGGLSVSAMLVTRFEAMSVQLAVLRAMGYARKEVALWLLWEGLLLGLGACVLGGAVDAVLFPVIRGMLGNALPGREIIESSVIQSAPVWIVAIVATTLAVCIPLVRLYRQDVHSSLRGL